MILPKAFVYVTFAGLTATIQNSFNVASVVNVAPTDGRWLITFTNPMSSANYAVSYSLDGHVSVVGAMVAIGHGAAGPRAPGSFGIRFERALPAGEFGSTPISLVVHEFA